MNAAAYTAAVPAAVPSPPHAAPPGRAVASHWAVALAWVLGGLVTGCQAATPGGAPDPGREAEGSPDGDGAAAGAAPRLGVLPVPGVTARPEVRVGAHGDDERFAAVAATWSERVARALERVPIVTGLSFAAGPPPRVVWTALGDETLPFELRVDVVAGRRRVAVLVNAEPHLAGLRDLDRTLLRALGTAALEDALARRGDAPGWVREIAGMAAAGDLDERLASIQRAWALGRIEAIRVDPDDARAAEATGVAALLLVAERGAPSDVHHLLRFVADGDDAGTVLGRIAGETGGGWVEPARLLLHQRVRDMDDAPWRLLERAETAYAESGPAGLESVLPASVPLAARDEIMVLRARAALDVGELDRARSLLRALPADAPARLREPAEALALRIEAELAPGGDRAEARRLLVRLRLDHPHSPVGARLVREDPTLGLQEEPLAWMAELRERIAAEGTAFLDLRTAERYGRMLLLDHRTGAAEGFLVTLGRRAQAPELQGLARAIAEAQEEPSRAAKARSADRLEAWWKEPTDARRQDLVDGGLATSEMIVEMVLAQPDVTGSARAAMLGLAAEAAGDERALRILEPLWQAAPARLVTDLPALTTVVSFDALDAALSPGGLAGRLGVAPEPLWEAVGGGLPVAWLRDHPRFLAQIRSGAYDDRRRALEALLEDPALRVPEPWLAAMLGDPAPRLRLRAAEQAGALGYRDLVRRALRDEQAGVRSAALRALVVLGGRDARDDLLAHLESETVPEVRSVAAFALLDTAADDPRALAVLLRLLRDEDVTLREPLAMALVRAPRLPLVDAVADAVREENARSEPLRAYLFVLMATWQRATGIDLGYYPGATREQVARMEGRMRAYVAEQRAAGPAR